MTVREGGYGCGMARRIREEIIDDGIPAPVTRRVVTERRVGGSPYGGNPAALIMAVVLAVFILVLVFGYLL